MGVGGQLFSSSPTTPECEGFFCVWNNFNEFDKMIVFFYFFF